MEFMLRMFGKVRYYLRFLKPVLKHVKNSVPVLLFLGFSISLVAIWWLGPKWEIGDVIPFETLMSRVLATVVIVLMVVVIFAIYFKKRLKASEEALLEAEEKEAVTPYIEAQEGQLNDVLSLLKENGEGKGYIYSLPWYIVLGGESAGKTSLINRTGQSFSFSTAIKATTGSSRGIRRRREAIVLPYKINWWMSNEAILIDPDGSLLEQKELNEEQEGFAPKLWQHFLGWLEKTRTSRPLNGVVLVIDLARLIGQQPSDRKAYAGMLRARLREMMEQLGIQLPVYIVLSKFDLIKGFDAYFHGIKKVQRESLFGLAFKLDKQTESEQDNSNQWLDELDVWYNQLLVMLNEQVFDIMSTTTVVEERENLFSFVRQLVGIKESLQEFLADILESDRFSTPAYVRGLYFSSVFQHGIPVNPFLETSARSYKVPLPVSSALPTTQSTTFFVKPLFPDVIYPEAGLAIDNKKETLKKRNVERLAMIVAGFSAIVVLAGFQYYYTKNNAMLEDVFVATQEYSHEIIEERIDETGKNLLPPLNHIRQASQVFVDYDSKLPVVTHLGLYQGRTVGFASEQIYQDLLSKRFLPAIATGLIEKINSAPYASDDKLQGLRVYRMIEDQDNRQKEVVVDWMSSFWKKTFKEDVLTQKQLLIHLDYAMDHVEADLPQFARWVKDTQTELRAIPLADRVYRTIKQSSVTEFIAPLDIRKQIGPAFDVIYKHGDERKENQNTDQAHSALFASVVETPLTDDEAYLIDAMLTKPGFKEYFIEQNKDAANFAMIDAWVLGLREVMEYDENEKKELRQTIRRIYVSDYINTWNKALRKLEINDFESIAHAVKILETLTGATNPLQRLIHSVKENTTIYAKSLVENVEVDKTLQLDPNRKAAKDIQKSFIRLTELIESKEDTPEYIEEVLKSISALHGYMLEIQEASNPAKKALTFAQDRFSLRGADPISILHRVANGLPEPLNKQLNKVSEESWRVILIQALQELERKWDKDVYAFYEQRLKNRYPLVAKGKDASLDDFTRFFAQDGILDTFHKDYLSIFMESNLDVLYSADRKSQFIREDLQTLMEHAKYIQDGYFNAEGSLYVPFTIEPLRLSGTQRRSILNLDGQIIRYDHGPAYAVDLVWPNTLQSRAESKIVMISSSGKSAQSRTRGFWSLFRLVNRGHVRPASNNSAILSFGLNKGSMSYRIRGSGEKSPLISNPLKGFNLPRYLLQETKTEAMLLEEAALKEAELEKAELENPTAEKETPKNAL